MLKDVVCAPENHGLAWNSCENHVPINYKFMSNELFFDWQVDSAYSGFIILHGILANMSALAAKVFIAGMLPALHKYPHHAVIYSTQTFITVCSRHGERPKSLFDE